jgi:hypothetical protein
VRARGGLEPDRRTSLISPNLPLPLSPQEVTCQPLAFVVHLVAVFDARRSPYEALDSSAMPTRDCKRRGHGWLVGRANVGWSNSLGWYEGFSLLTAVDPTGVITGFCFGAASTADQQLAETFFALRARPNERLLSMGSAAAGLYIADKGFEGAEKP